MSLQVRVNRQAGTTVPTGFRALVTADGRLYATSDTRVYVVQTDNT